MHLQEKRAEHDDQEGRKWRQPPAPATPARIALAYELLAIELQRIQGSELLTFDSTEHTAYTKNACINRAVNGYLLRGTLPPEGTVCKA